MVQGFSMPSWWGKFSSRDAKKKANKEGIIDAVHRRFKSASKENYSSRSGASPGCCSETTVGDLRVQSPPASIQVSCCQSFSERSYAQPLPLPGGDLTAMHHVGSQSSALLGPEHVATSLPEPIHKPGCVSHGSHTADAGFDLVTASASSDSSSDTDDPSDSHLLSPQRSDYDNVGKTAMSSLCSLKQKDQSASKRNLRERLSPTNLLVNNQTRSLTKCQPLGSHVPNLWIPPNDAHSVAPNSSMSSPSKSPMRVFGHELAMNCSFWPGKPYLDISPLGSAHCSTPGSSHNSGHNSVGGDMSGQIFWPHSRCSPECSQAQSPNMMSPGPSSRIHSGAVTPLHPQVATLQSPMAWHDAGKQQSYRLPLPPVAASCSPPYYPSHSAGTYPMVLQSPGRIENCASPVMRWKKGRLLGRGTFGQVYIGFNSESGEMCAMKEVTLLSDDPKSKESAQQLGQEIALLSRLHHPNIVQYYGSELVADKLYIYLEYVSGGSIYKLLQDYGQLGEAAIRSYTQQILSGLAYLHSKNTVHRDIKGANILVDPSGRVKLADFGMAKHITGRSCPLSFKGSPYWMAPEVIKNSNGCNLAVDIWSLGCTVLEMATSKPPWGQYEGVAAMFKIGNSKELPAIPDHLSNEGKDFIRICLQRNPAARPTAARLLEHPYIRNSSPFERLILGPAPIEPMPIVKHSMRSAGTMHCRNLPLFDYGAFHKTRGTKMVSRFSDAHNPRNISCPVSPIGRSCLHPQSPQHMSGRLSPSSISSPHFASGSSTPLSGGNGSIPSYHPNIQMNCVHDWFRTMTGPQNCVCSTANTSYQELEHDASQGVSRADLFQGAVRPESNITRDQLGQHAYGNPMDQAHGQSALAERVSQQLLRNPSVDLSPKWPVFRPNNGF